MVSVAMSPTKKRPENSLLLKRPTTLPQLTLIPCLQPQIAKLTASTDFGFKRPTVVANSLCSSAPLSERVAKLNHVADKFVIAIPYAEDYLYCHVSFCYDNPEQFPRIIVLKRRPMAGEDVEELEIPDFFPLYANESNSQEDSDSYQPQMFNFRDESTLLDLFKGLTEEFCAYQRIKLFNYPLLAKQVRELNNNRIAQAVEYRVYEDGDTTGRVFVVASLEPRFQTKNLTEMEFEVTIKMENFGDRTTGVRINIALSEELKNLFVRYPPPKFGDLSLLEYLGLVQTEIDNRLERLARSSGSSSDEIIELETSLSSMPIAD